MKLFDAMEIGSDLGLETVEEAVRNIYIHAMNMFPYDEITTELAELMVEYEATLV
jgi:hypothetical protein